MSKNTKEKVLEILKANSGSYVSGQKLADNLYVTRAAVWKAIKALKEEGYPVEGVNNKGYKLNMVYLPLSLSSIADYLGNEFLMPDIRIYDETASTNDLAREAASGKDHKECVFIADHQTKGRGRSCRNFYSPSGTGLYMSFLLYPDLTPSKASHITCMAAAAVKEALSEYTNDHVSIKWVNDIFIENKKIAGILTEAELSLETQQLSYVVVGIGINLLPPDGGFPENLCHIAGAMFPNGNPDNSLRNRICADIIRRVMYYYRNPPDKSWLEVYRSSSMLIGNYIKIKDAQEKEKVYAYVTGIDESCRLQIRYEDGTLDTLMAGEVSVVKY